MTPRGSRPSSGGRDGGRLLDPAAEGVDVVPQECPVGAHDQHVDDVEADRISSSGELTASQEVAAISRSPRLTDIRRAMTDSKNIPPAMRTIAVLRTHDREVRMGTVNVAVRMEGQARDDAAKLFSGLGVSTTQAISMFLKLPCPKERYRYYLSA